MSAIYNTEPQPTASVLIHTSLGELSVELFAKQTPLTSRNFLQHCLDGYYDNTVFHRLVPGFIIQGGDPTGTGNGGESIYDGGAFSGDLDPWPMDQRRGKNAGPLGINFKDEFHSRLKFNRRGLLGMANEGAPDTNGSQFFFTLDKADELNGKNTMFGRVVGDTIYNLAKLGEAELVEGTERPLYAIKISRVEILVNPFEDMKKRERVAKRVEAAPAASKKTKKRKVGKQLLSFGDEEGDTEELPILKKPKFDTRIVMDADEGSEANKEAVKRPQSKGTTKTPVLSADAQTKVSEAAVDVGETKGGALQRDPPEPGGARETSPQPPLIRIQPRREDGMRSPDRAKIKDTRTALEKANEEIAALKASMRRGGPHRPDVEEEEKEKGEEGRRGDRSSKDGRFATERIIPETSTRGRKRRAGANNTEAAEEQKTLSLLKAFQDKLSEAPTTKNQKTPAGGVADGGGTTGDVDASEAATGEGQVCDLHFIINCQSCQAWDKVEGKEESDDEGWMSHALSFAADKLGKDLSYRKKAEEELIVIDPREKARSLREGRRHEGSEGRAGGSGRARDQARNTRVAGAALVGRGAK